MSSKMSMFDLPVESRLPRIIGIINHNLFVYINEGTKLDIWLLNLYLPNSWQKKWSFKFGEIAYVTGTVMPSQSCIYMLFTGCYAGEETYCLDILKLEIDKEEYVRYKSVDGESVFSLSELYDIHFETDTLCCGESDLYIYDRGMVQGTTPFTRFILDHENKTFVGKSEPIAADESNIQPLIFGSLIDPDEKQFVKLAGQNTLRLFNKDLNKWTEFVQSKEGSDLYLNDLVTNHRGIGVTYNQEHTRFAIVASSIKLVAGSKTFILVYKQYGRVIFFRVVFNQETLQFTLKKISKISHSITQGYMHCDEDHLVVLSKPSYFVPLRVQTLKEIAFKTAQDLFDDPKDDSEIRKACGITHENSLI